MVKRSEYWSRFWDQSEALLVAEGLQEKGLEPTAATLANLDPPIWNNVYVVFESILDAYAAWSVFRRTSGLVPYRPTAGKDGYTVMIRWYAGTSEKFFQSLKEAGRIDEQ